MGDTNIYMAMIKYWLQPLIITITKFLILIGSLRVYLARDNVGVQYYSCPISTFCNWIPVIGHLRHSCSLMVSFFTVCKTYGIIYNYIPLTFSIIKEVLKGFLTSKFVIDTIN